MLELLTFLQKHVGQFKGEAHSCSWILLVLGEQDDDMMESAKALIALYLYQRRWFISLLSNYCNVLINVLFVNVFSITNGKNVHTLLCSVLVFGRF